MGYPQDSEKVKKEYADYLKGKRVVVVGPCPHMAGSNYGKLIDSYDIVVRVSKGYESVDAFPKDFGERIDVVYQTMFSQRGSGTTMPLERLKKKMTWVCASFPDKKHKPMIKEFIEFNRDRVKMHIMDKPYWEKLVTKAGIPQVGTSAIFDLLQYDIAELYITGITFYQVTGDDGIYYYIGYVRKPKDARFKTTKHSPHKAFKYFKEVYKKDKRIKCDEVLTKLVEN